MSDESNTATVSGERKSVDLGEFDEDVEVAGERVSVEGTLVGDEVELAVTGDQNSVEVAGDGGVLRLVHEGTANSVTTAPGIDVRTDDRGSRLSLKTDEELSTETGSDLIRQTQDEALSDLGWFGISTVRYQTPADQDRCRFCGRETDDVVHRHERRVLVLFGLTVTLSSGSVSDECQYCTVGVDAAELSEEERRDIYR